MVSKNHGFTLIEMIVAMAVYSILLVVLAITVTTFNQLNQKVRHPDSLNYQTAMLEQYIRTQWQRNNGHIIFTDTPYELFKIGGDSLTFSLGVLKFGDEDIFYANDIEEIQITHIALYNITIFEIIHNSKTIQRFILKNAGGNINEI